MTLYLGFFFRTISLAISGVKSKNRKVAIDFSRYFL